MIPFVKEIMRTEGELEVPWTQNDQIEGPNLGSNKEPPYGNKGDGDTTKITPNTTNNVIFKGDK